MPSKPTLNYDLAIPGETLAHPVGYGPLIFDGETLWSLTTCGDLIKASGIFGAWRIGTEVLYRFEDGAPTLVFFSQDTLDEALVKRAQDAHRQPPTLVKGD